MRTAIVLFNLGGPDGPDAVEPFLFNLFNDSAIITSPQPIRWLLAKYISKRRAPVAQEIYKKLGGGSPLLANTRAQADALKATLSDLGEVECFVCMRYWNPRCETIVQDVKAYNPDQIVLLPLYPQYSSTTTASSFQEWRAAARLVGLVARTRAICCYPRESGFVVESAARIREGLSQAENANVGTPRLLFSAHGLPKKFVDNGDPYQRHVELSAKAIVAELAIEGLDWRLCYQSRVGRLEWIRPYLEDEICAAGAENRPVVLFPIAFVSEHSETLVELDVEFRDLAMEKGSPLFVRVDTVGVGKAFIEGLATITRFALSEVNNGAHDMTAPGRGRDGSKECPCGSTFPGCAMKIGRKH
ncbi:MAG: ferrochelatase [Rhodospirillaceae bacterium]|jgi:protoporphyrin/coproporphyrin ferrochelatase|nr:ferrochelatase [Rhodospirillaceae bacterium]MBT5667715.1 ferrochelatase [Rhodospirillaceae bacterium]MBT5812624.1 ferrochelatase [Rhodospirillaceae bacterium]